MDLAKSSMPRVLVFTAAMTEPTAESFRQLIAGSICAPRKTILGAIRANVPTAAPTIGCLLPRGGPSTRLVWQCSISLFASLIRPSTI